MFLNITQVTESHPKFIKIKIVSEQAMTNVKYEIRSDVLYNKLNKSLNADTNINYEIIHDEIARAKINVCLVKFNKYKHKKSRLLLPTLRQSLFRLISNVTLLSVLDKHAPAAKSRVTEHTSSPWFGLVREDLLEAKRIRLQAERKWWNTNLTVLKDLYNKAKHHVTKVVLKAKKLYYNSKISSANCSKELYKITNNILARTKQVHLPTMYPLSSLPEMFSNYFSDKIMIIRNELDSQTISALPAQTDSFSGITLSTFEPVTEVMVKHVIMKSAPKTCSLDPIPTPLLLEILDCLLPSLTALINSSLSSGLFPQVFKSAVIFPLLKKPSLDPNELKNFRPIYNLPFISKIIEKLVLVQISHHLSANNLLNKFQSAYKSTRRLYRNSSSENRQ